MSQLIKHQQRTPQCIKIHGHSSMKDCLKFTISKASSLHSAIDYHHQSGHRCRRTHMIGRPLICYRSRRYAI
ncbi:unnamed protein product [Phytomonas sp. Hart1]|nr:unnamed protein product [Phytomonas sp. Hart1]|eukprot:CCW67596.1 unnamed protein product [Phytomonas sp. isolate Hart1]